MMIRLSPKPDQLVIMEIKTTLTQCEIFRFLQNKGYTIESWLWTFSDETFPGGESWHQVWTFTACQPGETQSEKTMYLNVFEKELKELLKPLV